MTGIRGPAATGLGKQVRAAQARLVVPFEDNRHLNRLLGEYDGHLALAGGAPRHRGAGPRQRRDADGARPPPARRRARCWKSSTRAFARARTSDPATSTACCATPAMTPRPPMASPRSARAAASSRARSPNAERLHPGPGARRSRVRPRPGRHRQDLSRRRLCRAVPRARAGRAHRAVAAGRGGRRAAGLPARRHAREGRSLSAPALRRALRRAAAGQGGARPRDRRDRDRAARLHARAHAGACLRHPRRGAEHDQHADEDVPDPPRRRLEDGGDRRSRARSTCRRASARASRRRWGCSRACAASRRSASPSADVVRRDLVARIVDAYDKAG